MTAVEECKKTYKIAVVDDKPQMLGLMTRILERNGYEVATGTDGKDAVLMADDSSIDAMVIDCTMTTMHGPEAVSAIRGKGKSLPIIMCSGDFINDYMKECGIDGYFYKAEVSEIISSLPRTLAEMIETGHSETLARLQSGNPEKFWQKPRI